MILYFRGKPTFEVYNGDGFSVKHSGETPELQDKHAARLLKDFPDCFSDKPWPDIVKEQSGKADQGGSSEPSGGSPQDDNTGGAETILVQYLDPDAKELLSIEGADGKTVDIVDGDIVTLTAEKAKRLFKDRPEHFYEVESFNTDDKGKVIDVVLKKPESN